MNPKHFSVMLFGGAFFLCLITGAFFMSQASAAEDGWKLMNLFSKTQNSDLQPKRITVEELAAANKAKRRALTPKISTTFDGKPENEWNKTLVLSFDQKIDEDVLTENLSVVKYKGKEDEIEPQTVDINLSTGDQITFTITPKNETGQWDHDFAHRVIIKNDFFDAGTGDDFKSSFAYVEKPKNPFYLQDMVWRDNLKEPAEGTQDYMERFELTFSESFLNQGEGVKFPVTPEPAQYETRIQKNKILIYGNFDASENYMVDLSGVQDRFGRELHFPYLELPSVGTSETESRFFKGSDTETFFYTRDHLPSYVFQKGEDYAEVKEITLNLCRLNTEKNSVFAETPFYFNSPEKLAKHGGWYNANWEETLNDKTVSKDKISKSDCDELVTRTLDIQSVRVLKIDLKEWMAEFKKPFGVFAFYQEDDQAVNYGVRYFGIMNTGILMKQGSHSMLAWAFDLENGEPVDSSTIYVKSVNKIEAREEDHLPKSPALIFTTTEAEALGTTGEDGILKTPLPESIKNKQNLVFIIQDEEHYGFVTYRWSDGLNEYNFPLENLDHEEKMIANRNLLGHVYTEKLLYRPGQTVHWKALFRERNHVNGQIDFPEVLKAKLVIENAQGEEIKNEEVTLNQYGSVAGEFDIPNGASLGDFKIMLSPYKPDPHTDPTEDNPNPLRLVQDSRISMLIAVQEYALPTFKFDTETEKHDYFANETISVKLRAREYTGNPIIGGKVNYRLIARPFYPEDKEDEGFLYASEGEYAKAYRNITILSKEAQIDENGNVTLEIPLDSESFESDFDYSLSLEITVTDDQNREVSDTVSFRRLRVLDEDDYIPGIRLPKKVYRIDEVMTFDYITKDARLSRVPEAKLDLVITEKIQKCEKQEAVGKGEINHCEIVEEVVTDETLKTDKNAQGTFSYEFKSPGKYQITLKNGDHTVSQEVRIMSKNMPPSTDNQEDRYLEIMLDKETYRQGEDATIFIHSPYERSLVLLTFEANEVVRAETIEMQTSLLEYKVPVEGTFVPNVYVSAVAVDKNNADLLPEFKIGYTNMAVETDSKDLQINITADKKEYKPGETVTLEVETKNRGGQGVSAEISVAAVDEAIIRLGGQVDTRFKRLFYSRRLLFVKNAFSLVGLHKDPIFATYGGAGKGGLSYDVPPVRKNFEEVAYWNAFVKTDEDGKATVTFTVPDKLTSYIVLGAGFSLENQLFGSSESTFSVQKDFFTNPILPRFLRKNDEFIINARVYNRTDEEAEVKILMEAEGVDILENPEKSNIIEGKSVGDFHYPIHVHNDKESATLTFKTISDAGTDAMEMTLPIKGYDLFSNVVDSEILDEEEEKFTVALPEYISRDQGTIKLEIAHSGITALKGQLKKLLRYPYGCAEQTTSTTVPNAIYYMLQKDLGIEDEQAKTNTEAGLARLQKFQKSDGGFNLWEGDTNSRTSVSETVGKGLALIHNAGFEIPSEMRDPFVDYLTNLLENKPNQGYASYNQKNQSTKLSDRDKMIFVYIASQLAPEKDFVKQVEMAFYRFPALSTQEKAMLADIYLARRNETYGQGRELMDQKLEIIKTSLWEAIEQNEEGQYAIKGDFKLQYEGQYHFYRDQDTALAELFSVLVKLDPKNENIEPLIAQIQKPRSGQHGYFSSFEERIRFLALKNYFQYAPQKAQGEVNFTLMLGENEYPIAVNPVKPTQFDMPLAEALNEAAEIEFETAIENFEDQQVYVNYDIEYFVDDIAKMTPTENNLKVWRTIKYHDDTEVPNFDNAKVGDIYWIDLHIENPEGKDQVAISDHLPANAEFITPPKSVAGFQHLDFRDDRLDAFLDDGKKDAMIGYKIRIISKGQFHWPPPRAVAMYNPEFNATGQGRKLIIGDNKVSTSSPQSQSIPNRMSMEDIKKLNYQVVDLYKRKLDNDWKVTLDEDQGFVFLNSNCGGIEEFGAIMEGSENKIEKRQENEEIVSVDMNDESIQACAIMYHPKEINSLGENIKGQLYANDTSMVQKITVDNATFSFSIVGFHAPEIVAPVAEEGKEKIIHREEQLAITGYVHPSTQAVEVNDYRLKAFKPGDKEFLYYASVKFGTLSEGENVFEVEAICPNQESQETIVKVDYVPSE